MKPLYHIRDSHRKHAYTQIQHVLKRSKCDSIETRVFVLNACVWQKRAIFGGIMIQYPKREQTRERKSSRERSEREHLYIFVENSKKPTEICRNCNGNLPKLQSQFAETESTRKRRKLVQFQNSKRRKVGLLFGNCSRRTGTAGSLTRS